MALCDEISHANFDSGTSSMQATPFKNLHANGELDSAGSNEKSDGTHGSGLKSSGVGMSNSSNSRSTHANMGANTGGLRSHVHAIVSHGSGTYSIPHGGRETHGQKSHTGHAGHGSLHLQAAQNNSTSSENSHSNQPGPPKDSTHSNQVAQYYNYHSTVNLKSTIQLIESQLDEAQRQAEIEKTLINAELKSEQQQLESDNEELKRIENEIKNLDTQYKRKIQDVNDKFNDSLKEGKNGQNSGKDDPEQAEKDNENEFLILEETTALETQLEEKRKDSSLMLSHLEKEIQRKNVRLETLRRQLLQIKDQERVDTNRLTKQRDICILQLQKVEKDRLNQINISNNTRRGHHREPHGRDTRSAINSYRSGRPRARNKDLLKNVGSEIIEYSSHQMQSSHRRFASTDGRHGHRLATSTKTINIIDREYGKNGFSYDSTSKLSQADSCGNILKAHDHDSPRIDRANEGIIDGQITGLNGPSYEKQQARLEEMKMLLKEIKTEQKALIKARSKMKLNSDTVSGSSHKIHHSHARSDTKSRDRDDSRRDIREMSSSRDLSRGRDGRDGRNSKLKSNSSMSSNPNLQNHPNHQNLPKVSSPKAVLTNQHSRVSNVGSFNVNGGQVNEPRFDISSVVSGSQIVQPEDSVSQNYTKRERSSSIPKSRPLRFGRVMTGKIDQMCDNMFGHE